MKKLYIIISILIAIIIIIVIGIFIALRSNPTLAYLQNTNETIIQATDALTNMQKNIYINSKNDLIYNQGEAYEYGKQFENIWNNYDKNNKNTPNIKDYYTKTKIIETQEKLAYNFLTNGVTLYLNGSANNEATGISYIKKAYSIINTLNKDTIPNTTNDFKEKINKIQT
ncbi:hypothetical protein [Sarcina ventriculi]|uniref:Uncharacterized protein n=1 Tax=Sarcina ventriculi TaxID=1267 RepID=A0ABM9US57_SARVE|nr:hypothetical protein [Sarcina ventriculi]CUO17166.1 Uncharacterised protein [Sarcina ventriculi]